MAHAADPVLLDVSPDGVAVVTLNRADAGNAIDELIITGLSEAFETLKGADHVRIVFLRGAGEVFCAGADPQWLRRSAEMTEIGAETDALALARMLKHLHDLPQLTVALVQGAAFGEGAGLVAACDWAVAVRNAKFSFADVALGLVPATIAPFVIEAIGQRWAKALFASGESFDGDLAEKIGLIQYALDDEAALHAIMTHFTTLALAAAPGAVADAKSLVRYVGAHKLDEALARETARRLAARRLSQEGREGLAAFLEKRKPAWKP
jgi:methylglutaconyl-CoA hydratase